jgi:branched-chain amino acid transport system substrate-binding protein
MNQKKVPQLFVATGATKWGDPKNFPWTMGWQPNYQSEAKIFAAHILETKPNAKIAVLYQNDDYGKDYLKGFEDGLGDKAKSMIVSKISYEVTDPTVDSQMVSLKASGADTFFNITTPEVRRAGDQEGGRDRLEAHALPEQRVGLGGLGADAGRCRERRGHLSPPAT